MRVGPAPAREQLRVLFALNGPQLSCIGLGRFPFSAAPSTVAKAGVESIIFPADDVFVSYPSGQARVKAVRDVGKSRLTKVWEIDNLRLVPVSYRESWEPQDKSPSATPVPLLVQRIDWQEYGGRYLPSSVRNEVTSAVTDPNGEQHQFLRFDEATLSWSRINQAIGPVVSRDKLKDLDFLLEWIK